MSTTYGDRERIERRLTETGLMDSQIEATMPLAHIGQLLAAAMETSDRALNSLNAKQVDPLALLEVQSGLDGILNRFAGPIKEQQGEVTDDPFQTVTFKVDLRAATAFTSLVVAAIVSLEMPKPTRPEPPYSEVEALISGQELLWWALLNLASNFPAPVREVLNSETGLNFEAIE